MVELRPGNAEEVAEALRERDRAEEAVVIRGGGSKAGWGTPIEGASAVLRTSSLAGVVEHNEGDLTAIVRAGTPLTAAQDVFGGADQMLAMDPWPGDSGEATIGGVVAAADGGPLRHRFGATRDLVLGIQFVTADGTVARSGSKVIKNVAGYDLAKLFTGSFGTLGVVTEVIVRLQPLPRRRVTVVGATADERALGDAARAVAGAALELECLDVAYERSGGRVLARIAGAAPEPRVGPVRALLQDHGCEVEQMEDDAALWDEQRRAQRAPGGVCVRVSARPTEITRVAQAARALGGSFVGRAAFGTCWVTLPGEDAADAVAAVEELRTRMRPYACVVLDAPEETRRKLDVWHSERIPALELMRRVKARFDPKRTCNPGIFVGGI